MAHSKAHMLDTMNVLVVEILALLENEDVKIKPDQLCIPDSAAQLRADFIRPAYHWLVTLEHEEFAAVRSIKKLLPEEIWVKYRTWGGFEDHRECVMLREALANLRQKIVGRDRPDFFKKTLVAKSLKRAEKKNTA